MVLYTRAKEVDPDRPFISEDRFFWRYLAHHVLTEMLDRTVQLFLPQRLDNRAMEGQIIQAVQDIKEICTAHPINFSQPLSSGMTERENLLKALHNRFVTGLTNRSHNFLTTSEFKKRGATMGALSRKRPLDDDSTQGKKPRVPFTRRSLLGATRGDEVHPDHYEKIAAIAEMFDSDSSLEPEVLKVLRHDEYEIEEGEVVPQVAAINNQAASKPGATGTPFKSKLDRKPSDPRLDASLKPQKKRRPDTTVQRPSTGKTQYEDDGQEDELPELPEPGESLKVIQEALSAHKVCHYHALGIHCPYNIGGRRCRFSHDNRIVKRGQYKQIDPAQAAAQGMIAALGSDVDGESVSTEGTLIDSE